MKPLLQCLCACACAYVGAGRRGRCARVALLIQHTKRVRRTIISGLSGYTIFLDIIS
jgi:hypothetical protein